MCKRCLQPRWQAQVIQNKSRNQYRTVRQRAQQLFILIHHYSDYEMINLLWLCCFTVTHNYIFYGPIPTQRFEFHSKALPARQDSATEFKYHNIFDWIPQCCNCDITADYWQVYKMLCWKKICWNRYRLMNKHYSFKTYYMFLVIYNYSDIYCSSICCHFRQLEAFIHL